MNNQRILLITLCLFAKINLYSQIRIIPIFQSTLIDLDSAKNQAKASPKIANIIIFDKVDTTIENDPENFLSSFKKYSTMINLSAFNISFLYFHHPKISNICTKSNVLNFRTGTNTLSEFPIPLPGVFIYVDNLEKRLELKKVKGIYQYSGDKEYLFCENKETLVAMLLAESIESKPSNSENGLADRIGKLVEELARLRNTIDSIIPNSSIPSKFIGLCLSTPSILKNKIVSGIDTKVSSISDAKLWNIFQLSFTSYPFKKAERFGYGVGLGYSKFSCDVGKESTIDTVNRDAYDPMGIRYTRIAFGNSLKEHIAIDYLSLLANLRYKQPTGERSFLTINPGIKISNVLSSTYQAKEGTMAWKGYYPQFNTDITQFDSAYDFYPNEQVYKEKKQLAINQVFVSAFLSVDWFYKFGRFCPSIGVYGECGSNMLTSNPKQSLLSTHKDDYNSLLYRSDKMKLNSIGARFGVSYSF